MAQRSRSEKNLQVIVLYLLCSLASGILHPAHKHTHTEAKKINTDGKDGHANTKPNEIKAKGKGHWQITTQQQIQHNTAQHNTNATAQLTYARR